MNLEILDEVAYLFVDQFDHLYGMLVDRTDVKRIRKAADGGLDTIYDVAASVFGDKLEDVLYGAAYTAMDSIAYADESWTPNDTMDKEMMLDMERLNVKKIAGLLTEAEKHFRNLESR